MTEPEKIIIIGAGPAGIVAGYELLKKNNNLEVIILEQSQAIGGISRTVRHNGNRMDIGGHRFFSKNEKVVKWWNDIMPMQGSPAYDDLKLCRDVKLEKGGPNPETADRVMLVRNCVSRIFYRKAFFDYPVKLNFNTIKNMGLITTIGAGFSYLHSVVSKKKEDSLENFYINRFGRKLYSMFFESYTEKLWGRHPEKISPDWGAQRVKGLSIRAVLKDIFTKEQDTTKIETWLNSKDEPVLDTHCEHVKKAYPAYFDTYGKIGTLIEYLNTFENLYCIGRNGQHRYNNMDHSMETAFEAVKNILTNEKNKSNIWNVNQEEEYHEEK